MDTSMETKKGGDARTRIIDAAVGLALLRDIDKLTVKEITDEAGVARRTFYHYFRDLPDLMDDILTEITRDMTERSLAVPDRGDVLDLFVEAMGQGWPVLRRILASRFRAGAEKRLLEAFKTVIGTLLTEWGEDERLEENEAVFLVDIISCMVMTYLLEHFERGDVELNAIKQNFDRIARAARR